MGGCCSSFILVWPWACLVELGKDRGILLIHGSEALLRILVDEVALGELLLQSLVLFSHIVVVIELNLLVHEFLVLRDLQAKHFEVKVKVAYWFARWLVLLEVESFKVRVRQGLLHGDTLLGVKRQHLLDQVDCLRVRALEQFVEVFASCRRQLLHESSIISILDRLDELCVGLANQIGDHHHLLLLGLGGQERLSADQLC